MVRVLDTFIFICNFLIFFSSVANGSKQTASKKDATLEKQLEEANQLSIESQKVNEKLLIEIARIKEERDTLEKENKSLQEKRKILEHEKDNDRNAISALETKLSKSNEILTLKPKKLNPNQLRVMKQFIKNFFFKAFKYVFPETLRNQSYGIQRCYATINVKDPVEQERYKKSIIKLLNVETSQRRHDCIRKLKSQIPGKFSREKGVSIIKCTHLF